MSIKRIKQLFTDFAKALPASDNSAARKGHVTDQHQKLIRPCLISGELIIAGEIYLRYEKLIKDISDLVKKEGIWCQESIKEALIKCLRNVVVAQPNLRREEIQTQAEAVAAKFCASPSEWWVDLAVSGLAEDCAGKRFGVIEFLRDEIQVQVPQPSRQS